jgi:uncharacterized protein YukE
MNVWRDVQFDHAAARSAEEELRHLAAVLDAMTDIRERLSVAARRDWEGLARQEADAVLTREHRAAADLVDELNRAADRIRLGAEEASVEQSSRQRRRDELRAESVLAGLRRGQAPASAGVGAVGEPAR